MTRVGRKVINVPEGTTVLVDGSTVVVKGPKGSLDIVVDSAISFDIVSNTVVVKNTDLIHPLQELPHYYHKADHRDNKRKKNPRKQGLCCVYYLGTV